MGDNDIKRLSFKGYAINTRMDRIEDNVEALKHKVNEIDLQITTQFAPIQGIYYDGQIFDAYVFVADLVKRAKKQIILLDNYVGQLPTTLKGRSLQKP